MNPVTLENLKRHLNEVVGDRSPHTARDHLKTVERYIESTFGATAGQVQVEPVTLDGMESVNVHCRFEGLDKTRRPILIGAHFDSIPNCPGADDNASAVAALLEMAASLSASPPAGPVHLVAFALEEYGFLGSGQLARSLHEREQLLSGMISLEMLGYTDKRPGIQTYPPQVDPAQYPDTGDFIAVVGNEKSKTLTGNLSRGMARAVPTLGVETLTVPGKGEAVPDVRRSDHVPFWDLGFSAVMLTDTANFRNPHYHQPTDTLDTLDLEFLKDVTEALLGYLRMDTAFHD